MTNSILHKRLEFIRSAERLKDTIRCAYTTQGRVESVADHSWRLTLLAITFADMLPDIDLLKLLKICILHDLGEAVNGDIPAPEQNDSAPKSINEREDFQSLLEPLPQALQSEFLSLWDEYENSLSKEAQVAKALDKIETILQHNQGLNPEDFDYTFNLGYGKNQTDKIPLASKIRDFLDMETAEHAIRKDIHRQSQ